MENKYGGNHASDTHPKKTAGSGSNNPKRPKGDSEENSGKVNYGKHGSGFAGYGTSEFGEILGMHETSHHDEHHEVNGAA